MFQQYVAYHPLSFEYYFSAPFSPKLSQIPFDPTKRLYWQKCRGFVGLHEAGVDTWPVENSQGTPSLHNAGRAILPIHSFCEIQDLISGEWESASKLSVFEANSRAIKRVERLKVELLRFYCHSRRQGVGHRSYLLINLDSGSLRLRMLPSLRVVVQQASSQRTVGRHLEHLKHLKQLQTALDFDCQAVLARLI